MGILSISQKGFTIIEVMLFLAVSGALAASVLGGSSVAINNQRYIDAANSFKALVQGEVIAATRIVNDATDSTECEWDQVYTGASSAEPKGTSDCVIMGRMIGVKAGRSVITANIIGKQPATDTTYPTDREAIIAYRPITDSNSQKTSMLNWDTQVQGKESFIIYIFRSPQSGSVVIRSLRSIPEATFDSHIASSNKIADIYLSLSESKQEVCIDASGWTAAQQQSIVINANASGPTGIEQIAGAVDCE